MSGEEFQEPRAPGRRTWSLHMDVRFLAFPENLYPAASATYGALNTERAKDRLTSEPPNYVPNRKKGQIEHSYPGENVHALRDVRLAH